LTELDKIIEKYKPDVVIDVCCTPVILIMSNRQR
jgi:hypothetical protein